MAQPKPADVPVVDGQDTGFDRPCDSSENHNGAGRIKNRVGTERFRIDGVGADDGDGGSARCIDIPADGGNGVGTCRSKTAEKKKKDDPCDRDRVVPQTCRGNASSPSMHGA